MQQFNITILPQNITVSAEAGQSVLDAVRMAGLSLFAPCGGKGTCGKCAISANSHVTLVCQTIVSSDLTVTLPQNSPHILTSNSLAEIEPDMQDAYVLAFDIGTTTVVCYLLSGKTGEVLSQASAVNPQTSYGADLLSRIQYALQDESNALEACIRRTISDLTIETAEKAGVNAADITRASIVGNTAMHHLFLGIDPKPLVVPPYMPKVSCAMELPAKDFLPISSNGIVRILPNIAGFVGADTVGCLLATRFDQNENIALMLDIGTNGEMVMGNAKRYLACSTAAGPAFEGANISCGMGGMTGAVDHVYLDDGRLVYHVIGNCTPAGLCGSGLLDLIAVLLEMGHIDNSGRLLTGTEYRLGDTDIVLTQRDVREVQLAKAAIRAGIELMAKQLGIEISAVQIVYLAGAFGNYLNPSAACRIGLLPPQLLKKIRLIGNAAGEGAKRSVLRADEFAYSQRLAARAEFLELASLPQFQDCFVDAMGFGEDTNA